jgi:hypothetical protein
MKRTIALIFAASALGLAGCCTTPHVSKWEYKVADLPRVPGNSPNVPGFQDLRSRQQDFLNELGKDGWVLVSESDGRTFYLKRPLK